MSSKPWPEEHIAELRKHYPTMGASAMHKAGMCGGRSAERIRKTAVDMGLKIKPAQKTLIRSQAQLNKRDSVKKGQRELAIPRKKRVDSFRQPEPRFVSVWAYAQGVQV